MLTESATATALRSKRAADGRKKRRTAATPYGTAGAAHGSAGSDSDEEVDGSEDEHEKRRGRAGERHHEKRGFFSRFVSYLPLVGKFVPDENEDDSDMTRDEAETAVEDEPETVHADDDALEVEHIDEDSHSDDGEEHDAVFVASNGRPRDDDIESVGSETVRGPPTPPSRESPSSVETVHADAAHHVENGKQPAKTHAKRHKPQESSPPVNPHYTRSQCRSPSHERSAEKAERAPAHRPQRKRNDQRAFLPAPSQKSKMLRISSSQRRRKSSSPSPSESARTLIKQQKTISYAEYERLSRQLRDLVEPTPQAALALTKSALDEGLEEPVQTSRSTYVPGSIATHTSDSSAHDGSDVAVRRLQNGENATALTLGQHSGGVHRPLSFSGPAMRGQFSSHDDRLGRRHRPSRLLTGTKNDITSRSAYSAAVAEKILSTLNKIQNPLEREARKPTPSTSVSWAKYHLALVDEVTATERSKADEKDLKSAPPTASLPRVPVVSSTSLAPKSVLEKPSAKLNNGFASTNGASLSSQAISTTAVYPAVNAAVPAFSGNAVSKTANMGLYSFTLPRKVLGGLDEDEDMDIHFEFSLPSALREPPKQVASSSKPKGMEAAFSFVPPSPKQKAEWAPKSVKPKEPVSAPVVEKSPVKQVSSVPASAGTNPLARFMQVTPGTWKCPSCSVTNQDKFSKCPCCETAKPTSSSSASSSPAPSKPAPAPMASGASNPLARFMQVTPGTWKCPTCSVTNEDKFAKCPCCDTAKPGGVSSAKVQTPAVTSSGAGFSFGVTASSTADTKKSDKVSSTGFSFGVTPSTKDDAPKPASSSAGFSFGVPATTEKSSTTIAPATSGFSFGVAPAGKSTEAASESKSTGASKPASFSFGVPTTTTSGSVEQTSFTFSAPVKEVTSSTEKPSELATTSPAPSFSFSAPSTTTSSAPSFSFGASATVTPDEPKKAKRKAEDSISEVKTSSSKKPSGGFAFGSSAPAPVSSFGSPANTDAQKSEDSDRPTKKVFTQAALKESPSVPAFSFGVPPAGEKKDTTSTGAKSFGGSFTSIAANSATAAPVVSFGSKTDEAKPTAAGSFGSFGTSPETKSSTPAPTSSAVPAAFAFSAPSSANKNLEPAKGFSFGVPRTSSTSPVTAEASAPIKPAFSLASSSSPDPASSKPAFTFGQSASSGTGLSSSSSSTAFGSTTTTTTSSSGFGFGAPSSTSAAASAPATSSAAPSFTFGASSSSPSAPSVNAGDSAMDTSGFGSTPLSVSPAFGQPGTAPSPTFGVSATQPATAFGSSGTGSFRSSSPATGQAAAFGGFRSISPAPAPGAAFGGAAFRSSSPAPTSTPAFGSGSTAPSSSGFTFGASSQAPTSAMSQPPQPQSFGFGAPTSTGFGGASGFGSAAAPTSTGFGAQAAAPATTFGAGTAAFGASPAPAFGAPAAPAAPAFGAPTQGGAFGAAPAFGGAASGFGSAPAPAFGAAPSAAAPAFGGSAFGAPSNPSGGFGAAAPAAAGFGQPADGGFSMGAAPPQHAKGRRILKARSRRTT